MSETIDFTVDFSDPDVVSSYDELSLWSAMFGQMLLDRIPMRRSMTVLDVGYGTGFPALELAQRLGKTCRVYGIDPWDAARQRAEFKARVCLVTNVELLAGDAAAMPFPDAFFDLVVSNLGVNNFSDPLAALGACARVMKTGARLALTSNLQGHMREFYTVYEDTLRHMGKQDRLGRLNDHIAHRGTLLSLENLLKHAGLRVVDIYQETAVMRFLDGSALLGHSFIKRGFLDAWIAVLGDAPREEKEAFFMLLLENLDHYAEKKGGLSLTIPMVYMEAEKEKL